MNPLQGLHAPAQRRGTRHVRGRFAVLAAICALGMWASAAHALALGAISLQSALGEPLHAEIELSNATADDTSALTVDLAAPKGFQAAGIEYHDALKDAKVSVQRRASGEPYIRILGIGAVDVPVIHVLLSAHWTHGHITRGYTVLVDPRGRAAVPSVVATQADRSSESSAQNRIPVAIQTTADYGVPDASR